MNIKIITLLDTNCDPFLTDYLIPCNDDSVLSINFVLKEISKVIICEFIYLFVYTVFNISFLISKVLII